MGILTEDVECLTCLGLTERQARVYLSLVISGPSSVKVISKISTVPRQETYRVIDDLYNKGFIEKIITNPITFKATPIQQATEILLQNKEAELDRTATKTSELIEKFEHKRVETVTEEPSLRLVSGLSKVKSDSLVGIEKDQLCVDLAGPWEVFLTWLFSSFDSLQKEKQRNVSYRVIINKPKNAEVLARINSMLSALPNFTVRFSGDTAPFHISIHDRKLVTLSLLPHYNPNELNIIKSSNRVLMELTQIYFDTLWDKLA